MDVESELALTTPAACKDRAVLSYKLAKRNIPEILLQQQYGD